MSTSLPDESHSEAADGSRRGDRGLIAFLAALSGLSAFGIDLILPG